MNIKYTDKGKLNARATVDEIRAGRMVYAEHAEWLVRQAFSAGLSRGWQAAKSQTSD